jgi:hypothetical protein|tara:strand:- start:558 stop:989 length:432 start_codon:yes stop_codon:yes gene_type:complete
MADLVLPGPQGAEDATTSIWTPTEVRYIQSWVVGEAEESKVRAIKHEFVLNYMGETEYFGVLAEEGCSEAQIEDMAAGTLERVAANIVEKRQRTSGKKTPEYYASKANVSERHDLAEAFRDFKKDSAKRRASSNNRIFYPGLK